MKDHNRAFRAALFGILENNLADKNGRRVDVYDEKVAEGTKLSDEYVILSVQNSIQIPTFSAFLSDVHCLIKIVTKQKDCVSKEMVDYIANQIVSLLKPTPSTDGLTQQTGFKINCLKLETQAYNDATLTGSKTEIVHLLRASAKCSEL